MSRRPAVPATTVVTLAAYAVALVQLWRLVRELRAAHHAATHDPLTGLANRTGVFAHLSTALREQRTLCVAVLDLDAFKPVNDTLGHATGDELLSQVAARLNGLECGVRLVARLAGDEFVLVIDGDLPAGMTAATAAHRALGTPPFNVRGRDILMSASVGVTASRPGTSPRQLLNQADLAMYQAKNTRSGVRTHSPATTTPLLERPAHRQRDRHDDPAGTSH